MSVDKPTVKQFLRTCLADGRPKLRSEIKQAAEDAGISFGSVVKAKSKLGIVSKRRAKTWRLPHEAPTQKQLDFIEILAEQTGERPTPRSRNEAHRQIEVLKQLPTLKQIKFLDDLCDKHDCSFHNLQTKAQYANAIGFLLERQDEPEDSTAIWAEFEATATPNPGG